MIVRNPYHHRHDHRLLVCHIHLFALLLRNPADHEKHCYSYRRSLVSENHSIVLYRSSIRTLNWLSLLRSLDEQWTNICLIENALLGWCLPVSGVEIRGFGRPMPSCRPIWPFSVDADWFSAIIYNKWKRWISSLDSIFSRRARSALKSFIVIDRITRVRWLMFHLYFFSIREHSRWKWEWVWNTIDFFDWKHILKQASMCFLRFTQSRLIGGNEFLCVWEREMGKIDWDVR